MPAASLVACARRGCGPRRLARVGQHSPCISAEHSVPPAPARFAPLPRDALARASRARSRTGGIDALYSHQAEAIDAALAGRHVVVATPTASGKSLCFHVPVLEALLARSRRDRALSSTRPRRSRAIRSTACGVLLENAGVGAPATVFDGDTPDDARRAARERCRIVLTNPDMLHAGILPSHARWARFFQGLALRRVRRASHLSRRLRLAPGARDRTPASAVARFHGAEPTFIGATATIGNPREHAARLFGVEPGDVTLVDRVRRAARARARSSSTTRRS